MTTPWQPHPSKASSQINKLAYQVFQQQVSAKKEQHLGPCNSQYNAQEGVKPPPPCQATTAGSSGCSRGQLDVEDQYPWEERCSRASTRGMQPLQGKGEKIRKLIFRENSL